MGYPLRWEEIVAPEIREAIVPEAVEKPAGLRMYFRRVALLTLACSALVALAVMGVFGFLLRGHESPALRPYTAASGAQVAAGYPAVVRRVGYVTVSGSVLNRTKGSLRSVEAVVDLLDTKQRTVLSASAMVNREQIAPGQASSYQVAMLDSPKATGYRVRFRQLFGPDLK